MSAGPNAGGQPIGAAEFASRRVIGVVFVVLIFLTLVIYGMWVAAGVVAEKSSRVMELLISAASPAELVLGKVVGIGVAGLVQYVGIVVPALVTVLLEDRIAGAVLGATGSLGVNLGVLTAPLLAAEFPLKGPTALVMRCALALPRLAGRWARCRVRTS